MKKIFYCLIPALMYCVMAAGCSAPGADTAALDAPKSVWEVSEDITISLKESSFPEGTTEFIAVFENRGTVPLLYGEQISFEKFIDGEWQSVKTIENYGFTMIGYLLQGGDTQEFTISTWFLAEPLSAGRYRVTGCSLSLENPDSLPTQYPPYQLEFDIE